MLDLRPDLLERRPERVEVRAELPCAPAAASVWQLPQPADRKTAAPAATFAPAGTVRGPAAACAAGCRYSQSALVYQTAISMATTSGAPG